MAELDIGKHCQIESCSLKDFLPFICDSCSGVFCLEHRSREAHSCSEHFCLFHRHQDDHKCEKLEVPKPRMAATKELVQKIVESKGPSKAKGRRGAKNSATAAKVALMKLKLHASGDKGLPQAERTYFQVYLPKESKNSSQPMFFCSKWSVGKMVDFAASQANLKNNNNVLTAKKLRLCHPETGEAFRMDDTLLSLLSQPESPLYNGGNVILEYLDTECRGLEDVSEYITSTQRAKSRESLRTIGGFFPGCRGVDLLKILLEMKLLENSSFEALSSQLCVETGESRILGRIESYSCKMAGDDKHMFKQFCQEGEPHVLEALSPPQSTSATSPSQLGKSSEDGENPLSDKCCRKTLFYLITTLNESFRPDYDFSAARAHEFSREPSVNWVANAVNTSLFSAVGEEFNSLGPELWNAIDEEINLQGCDIYSYNPDLDSDPFGEEGSLWSFNYFFYNKKLKRIVFLTCRSVSVLSGYGRDCLDNELDMELGDEEEMDGFTEDRCPRALCV
ncbi:hypothetical protein Q5P01_004200 [Channa striata]|uniref:Repressor of RNA polymerase III transcription MAF1 homolog n=1 Tax=Channa striata TaxID=64152 RepID=A0AA88NTY9_CHASR|nr:hypothetical protein Q5P01_004200 [Channa striata]